MQVIALGGRSILLLVCFCCAMASTPALQAERYSPGDRVEVNRADRWLPGSVISSSGTRVKVRLDDDGSHGTLPADLLERRLTRSFYTKDVRRLREGAASPTGASTGPTTAGSRPPGVRMPASAGSRTWKDQTGRFSIEATYAGMNGDKVRLRKTDGSQIEVPLDKLSDADQQFVSSQGGDPDNPFAVAPVPGLATPGGSAAPIRAGDKSQAKTIAPQSFTEWSFAPESSPIERTASGTKTVRLGSLPDSNPFFEEIQSLDLSSAGDRAIVARKQGNVGQDEAMYLEYVDLNTQRTLGLTPLPAKTKVLAVHADSGRVAYRPDDFHGDNEDLMVAQLNGTQLTPINEWKPYPNERFGPSKETEAAWFVGDGLLMTLNSHGKALTLWNPDTAEAIAILPVSHGFRDEKFAVSPDGRYLAVVMSQGIAIIDLNTLEHVATIDLNSKGFHLSHVAFKADNQKLVAMLMDAMMIWDLNTGVLLQDFKHSTLFSGSPVVWADDLLFHRNQYVYDYERRILLWEFEGISMHGSTSALKNGTLCLVPQNREGPPVLRTYPLPSSEMKAKQQQLGSPEDLIVASAGDSVSLELDIDERVISAEQVRQAVTANLQQAGYVVAEGSDLVVTAVCKQLPSKTIKINMGRSRFRPRPEDIVERTITPHPSSITMTYQGKRVWGRSNMGRPGMTIWIDKDETVDQALQRLTTPNTKLINEAEFPKEVIRPGDATRNGAYGATRLGGGGPGGARFE